MQLEADYLGKAGWFFWQPLANALGLYALRDNFEADAWIFWSAVIVTLLIIGLGLKTVTEPVARKKWLVCLVVLPFVAHAVSLAAAERALGYRTLFALSGLVLVLVMFALRSVFLARRVKPWLQYTAFGVFAVGAGLAANHNSFALMAEPQNYEWELVLTSVMRTTFKVDTKVYIITPTPEERSTEQIFADEFGSLSSDSETIPKEMFRVAMRERFGPKLPKGISYTIACGRVVPPADSYDLVIDMRKLSKWRVR